jgi:hypothetical protein
MLLHLLYPKTVPLFWNTALHNNIYKKEENYEILKTYNEY